MLALLVDAAALAADLYVPAGYETVGAAVLAAQSSDVIHVAAGTFPENAPIRVIGLRIAIVGDPGAIVQGSPTDGGLVFDVSEGAALELVGLEIDAVGGTAISVSNAEAVLTGVTVSAAHLGGVVGHVAEITVASSRFVVAPVQTTTLGFLSITDGTLTVDDTTFEGGIGLDGALLYATRSSVDIAGATVSGMTTSAGGLIHTVEGTFTLYDSVVADNITSGSLAKLDRTAVVVDSTELLRNTAEGSLLLLQEDPSAVVHGNLLCENVGFGESRVVAFQGTTGAFTNNVVRFGSTMDLGVVASGAASVTATNNTVLATSGPQGSALAAMGGGQVIAVNNVVAYSEDTVGGALHVQDGESSLDFTYGLLFANIPTHATGFELSGPGLLIDVDPGFPAPGRGNCTIADLVPLRPGPLVDTGDPSILDHDGSVSDLGATGGPDPIDLEHQDNDGDGYEADEECDDLDPLVHPGAAEILCNLVDDDCLEASPDAPDADGDKVGVCEGDCDDTRPDVHPGKPEHCDGYDQDCDGAIDEGAIDLIEGYVDADGDYFGAGDLVRACELDPATSTVPGDCDDLDADVNPNELEVRDDGVDQDCDGVDLKTELGGAVGFACGCRTASGGAPSLGLLALLVLRRRARST